MTATHAPTKDHGDSWYYQIRVHGHLDDGRAAWFEGLTLQRVEDGDTLLSGPVIDQAALHGLLRKVRDLGMPLVSVIRVKPGGAEAQDRGACCR